MKYLIAVLLIAFLSGCAGNSRTQAVSETSPAVPIQSALPSANPPAPMHIPEMNITREIRGDILTTDTKIAPIPHFDFLNRTNASGSPIVYYFYSPGCSACKAFKADYERIKAGFEGVEWREYDITSINGSLAYSDYRKQWNLTPSQMYTPQVLVNGSIITDRFKINATLPSLLENLTGQ